MSEQHQPDAGHENPVRAAPDLSRPEKIGFGCVAFLAFSVSVLGLISSYNALTGKALLWGWNWPWLLPVGTDLAIPAFAGASLYLIRTNMAVAWVAFVPRALTAATVYLNWSAGAALAGRIGHAVLILLWVAFSEIAGHIYAIRIGAVTGTRMEKIRRARWVLAPISTAVLQRRMILWEITSYAQGLRLERNRLIQRAAFRERYGRAWRWSAPIGERILLKLGDRSSAGLATAVAPDARPLAASPAPAPTASLPPMGVPVVASPTPPVGDSANASERQADAPSVASASDRLPPAPRQRTPRPAAKRAPASRGRSMDEWVELAAPIFHAEFTRLRRKPTGDEFATAIRKAGHGTISASTAKNIRTEILDRADVPALSEEGS